MKWNQLKIFLEKIVNCVTDNSRILNIAILYIKPTLVLSFTQGYPVHFNNITFYVMLSLTLVFSLQTEGQRTKNKTWDSMDKPPTTFPSRDLLWISVYLRTCKTRNDKDREDVTLGSIQIIRFESAGSGFKRHFLSYLIKEYLIKIKLKLLLSVG